MRCLVAVIGMVATASAGVLGTPFGPSAAVVVPETVSVQVDRAQISVNLGERFSFHSTVRNQSGRPVTGLIAHLNLLSTDPSTYVDPEDWSTHRTQYLDTLPSHASVTLTWPMQAVNTGGFAIYVAAADIDNQRVTVSRPVQLSVKRQQTIDPGGIVPLAVAVPSAVAGAFVVLMLRRRRE